MGKSEKRKMLAKFDEMRESLLDAITSEELEYRGTAHLENGIESQNHSPLAPILTLDDLAKHLKVSKATAYDLVKQMDFPAFNFGKQIRVIAYMM